MSFTMQKYKKYLYRVRYFLKKRFRSLTEFAAEWCAPPYETKKEKMGGGREISCNGSIFLAAHLLLPFPYVQRTIPPVTIGSGGISSVYLVMNIIVQRPSRNTFILSLPPSAFPRQRPSAGLLPNAPRAISVWPPRRIRRVRSGRSFSPGKCCRRSVSQADPTPG